MAHIITLEGEHGYQRKLDDGSLVPVPSISEVLRFLTREIYSDINQYTLDKAAERGTRIHKACEVLDLYHEVNCDDDIVPQVSAYAQFLKDVKPKWTEIEKPFDCPELNIAGTPDRVGFMFSKSSKLDIKAQEQLKLHYVSAQLNGYDKGKPTDLLYCLQLLKNGKYKLIEIPHDDTVFMACLTLHRLFEKKGRRKKNEDGNALAG